MTGNILALAPPITKARALTVLLRPFTENFFIHVPPYPIRLFDSAQNPLKLFTLSPIVTRSPPTDTLLSQYTAMKPPWIYLERVSFCLYCCCFRKCDLGLLHLS